MRKLKKINEENSELRLANVLKVVIDWIDAWILAVVAGRGMSKSTGCDLLSKNCIFDLINNSIVLCNLVTVVVICFQKIVSLT